MKPTAIVFFLLIYLLPSIGITISKHYCGGELSSTNILCLGEHECGCGEKKMKADCCRDEATVIKIDDSQNYSQPAVLDITPFFPFTLYNGFNLILSLSDLESNLNTQSVWHPPDKQIQALFIKFGVLII